ncbi:PTS system IIA component, Glc family [Caloramator quimbayensis]|uniref:PTS system IIA component, Glc family n=1 Tax=Caloramator quimbayensis TaxID=1147123 RepID=A0A1T4Y1M6_9CLOT|nr:PTS glucose transporter subunit IIA [Caloramator quimbayensis]SKA95185.1 PTS system IIA component, Glc family [Caloramator quimbayensis]
MFDLIFKKANNEVVSPVSGKVLELSEVEDEAFKSGIVGEGIAIIPEDDIIKSPIDGRLAMIFKTNHAFAVLSDDGAEILVHIGMDTVRLNGEGFTRLIEEGQNIKKGQEIIKIDRKLIESRGYSIVTPVVITNPEKEVEIKVKSGDDVKAVRDVIFKYKLK